MLGYCNFCGQAKEITSPRAEQASQEDLNILATCQCECPDGRNTARMINQIAVVKARIEKLFGVDAVDYGFEPYPEAAESLNTIGKMICEVEEVESATIKFSDGVKCKILKTASGKIRVERSETKNVKLEEGQ